jgi:hypothetical protein
MLNLTFGLHLEFFNRTQLRLAAAVPMTTRDDSFFMSEIHVSIIRKL